MDDVTKGADAPFDARFVTPLALGSMLNPINSTMISTALVAIATELHASVAEAGWLIAGLYLTSAIAQPTMGRLAVLFGARRVYLVSLCLVALSGLVGAFAPSLAALVGVRVLLGIGTSGAYPSAMRLFRTQGDRFGLPPPRAAMSVLSFSGVATTAVGPVLGGVLTGLFGWHAIFTVNLPLALLTIVLVLLWVPKDQPGTASLRHLVAELDLAGIALFSAFLLSLMLFLMQLDHPNWLWLLGACVFCVALIVHSLRRRQPFLDVRMLARNRPLTVTYIRIGAILLIGYCVLYGFAQWLESAVGFSSAQAGLITLPMSVVAAVASLAGGRTKGIRTPFVISTVALLIGCIGLLLVDSDTPVWMMALVVAFFGLPMGMASTATQAAVYIQAPASEIGTAAGLQRTATYIGAIAATSLLGLVYGQHVTDGGLHALATVMGVLSAVLVVAIILDRTIPRSTDPGGVMDGRSPGRPLILPKQKQEFVAREGVTTTKKIQHHREATMDPFSQTERPNPSHYELGLGKRPANYTPLSPLSFLPKAAAVHPERIAIVHGAWRSTWAQCYTRCRRLASALTKRGVGIGDTVAVMAPNIPAIYEAHFGVPMVGAVLNTLNVRLNAEAIAFQLAHGEAKLLITDREFSGVIKRALALLERPITVIDIDDPQVECAELLGEQDYEAFLMEGDPDFAWALPSDEFGPIALNYTSGTTGNPKGVVTHHRGAYLNAVSQIMSWGMPAHAVYLWTLPMFHCNGWCFPWAMAANAGVNVCLRRLDAKSVFDAIRDHSVTHMCGAPIVYSQLINAPAELREGLRCTVNGLVAGAAPPASTIEGMERIGFDITHVYGLTETYGPAAICAKQAAWPSLPLDERARLNARQGVASLMQEEMSVLDPITMKPVPPDGETIGEIMFRGNVTMNGYLKNPTATEEAFAGGWFHTGDLAVLEPDGYVRIKDRSKDVIISGGENISSIEVEDVMHRHPAVNAVAVVAKADEKWGEVPCAFVELKPDATATAADICQFCRAQMAGYKVPKLIVFGPIPRTSTGKIQKFMLRETARSAMESQP